MQCCLRFNQIRTMFPWLAHHWDHVTSNNHLHTWGFFFLPALNQHHIACIEVLSKILSLLHTNIAMIVASSFRSSCFERLFWWLWSSPSTSCCSLISSCFCDRELFVIHAFVPVAFSAFYLLKAVWKMSFCWELRVFFFFPFESLLY